MGHHRNISLSYFLAFLSILKQEWVIGFGLVHITTCFLSKHPDDILIYNLCCAERVFLLNHRCRVVLKIQVLRRPSCIDVYV